MHGDTELGVGRESRFYSPVQRKLNRSRVFSEKRRKNYIGNISFFFLMEEVRGASSQFLWHFPSLLIVTPLPNASSQAASSSSLFPLSFFFLTELFMLWYLSVLWLGIILPVLTVIFQSQGLWLNNPVVSPKENRLEEGRCDKEINRWLQIVLSSRPLLYGEVQAFSAVFLDLKISQDPWNTTLFRMCALCPLPLFLRVWSKVGAF